MKKRIISLMLVLVIILGMTPAASAANHPFTDVPSNKWYAQFVEHVYVNGLMSGSSATTFEPDATMTRAMTVTVLYRLAGNPSIDAKNPFTDVPAGKWYTNAVLWAVENGITSGTSKTKFSPNAYVTREQMVTFLYRYAETLGKEMNSIDLTNYSDYGKVATYARTPFSWAVATNIICGTDASHLSPKETATRAQCATILARFDQWVKSKNETPAPSDPTEPTECQHNFTTTVVYPTTESEGYNLHTCQYCGYQYKDTYTDKLPTDNTEPSDPTDPPAPTEPGHEHSYKKDQVVEPTCTEKGYTVYMCECGDSYKGDTVSAKGHSYEVVEVVPPTCQETGWTEYKCSNCGDVCYSDDTDPTGHSYEVVKVVAPTCEEDGWTEYKCATCGKTRNDDETKATGHSNEVVKVVAPTCEEDGWTEYKCVACGKTSNDDKTKATGHDYTCEVIESTTTSEGYTLYTCKVCGHQYMDDYTEPQPTEPERPGPAPEGEGKPGEIAQVQIGSHMGWQWQPSTGIWTGEQEGRAFGFLVEDLEDIEVALASLDDSYPDVLCFFSYEPIDDYDPEIFMEGFELSHGLHSRSKGHPYDRNDFMPRSIDPETGSYGEYYEYRLDLYYGMPGIVRMYREGILTELPNLADYFGSDTEADYTFLLTAVENIEKEYGITAESADYEKVLAAYRYCTENIVYDHYLADLEGNDSVEYYDGIPYLGEINLALMRGKGVCFNYALTFQALCQCLHVNCYTISGDVGDVGHAWNVVEVDGKWYHADSCWDAGSTPDNYSYFLVSDEYISESRTIEYKRYNYPKCPEDYNP